MCVNTLVSITPAHSIVSGLCWRCFLRVTHQTCHTCSFHYDSLIKRPYDQPFPLFSGYKKQTASFFPLARVMAVVRVTLLFVTMSYLSGEPLTQGDLTPYARHEFLLNHMKHRLLVNVSEVWVSVVSVHFWSAQQSRCWGEGDPPSTLTLPSGCLMWLEWACECVGPTPTRCRPTQHTHTHAARWLLNSLHNWGNKRGRRCVVCSRRELELSKPGGGPFSCYRRNKLLNTFSDLSPQARERMRTRRQARLIYDPRSNKHRL